MKFQKMKVKLPQLHNKMQKQKQQQKVSSSQLNTNFICTVTALTEIYVTRYSANT